MALRRFLPVPAAVSLARWQSCRLVIRYIHIGADGRTSKFVTPGSNVPLGVAASVVFSLTESPFPRSQNFGLLSSLRKHEGFWPFMPRCNQAQRPPGFPLHDCCQFS